MRRPRRSPLYGAPNCEAQRTEFADGTPVRYRQTQQFTPARRRLARNLVVGAGAPNEGYAVYNHLRTQILQRLQENHWNTVAITSPSKSSGKHTHCNQSGDQYCARLQYTVLVVELDLVNPSFQRILGFKQRQGIVIICSTMCRSGDPAEPGIDRLVVIPAGSPITNSSELLSSRRWRARRGTQTPL